MSKKFLIVGLGVTGLSVARYLLEKKQEFMFYDTRPIPPLLADFKQKFPQADFYCEHFPEEKFTEIQGLIISPGLAQDAAILSAAKRRHLRIENDLDCLSREIANTPLVAITGSNGKSTVTTWVGEIAKLAGLQVAVGGNLGTPVLDLLLEGQPYDLWVLELSSFQLAALHQLNILAAANLNVSPDHLDVHGTMENYIAAKQRIFAFAQQGVFNREDLATIPQHALKHGVSFGLSSPKNANEWGLFPIDDENWIVKGQDPWIKVNDLKLQGQHHWLNAMASAALAEMVGLDKATICRGLAAFKGLHHRTEWVAELDGITYINDSKGTNLGATIAAIQGIGATIAGKIVLIAGGLSKGADMRPLQPLLQEFVKHVVLIGQDANILEQAWKSAVNLSHAESLQQALDKSRRLAEPGDVVLLSPACASFDMFKGYEDRGQQFVRLVQGWLA